MVEVCSCKQCSNPLVRVLVQKLSRCIMRRVEIITERERENSTAHARIIICMGWPDQTRGAVELRTALLVELA